MVQAADSANSVAAVVWPDGNDAPLAAPAQSATGGRGRLMTWLIQISV
jgi:hypothetical protein